MCFYVFAQCVSALVQPLGVCAEYLNSNLVQVSVFMMDLLSPALYILTLSDYKTLLVEDCFIVLRDCQITSHLLHLTARFNVTAPANLSGFCCIF